MIRTPILFIAIVLIWLMRASVVHLSIIFPFKYCVLSILFIFIKISIARPFTDESNGHCTVTNGIISENKLQSNLQFSTITSTALLTAVLLPIPELPIIVNESDPPIILLEFPVKNLL